MDEIIALAVVFAFLGVGVTYAGALMAAFWWVIALTVAGVVIAIVFKL